MLTEPQVSPQAAFLPTGGPVFPLSEKDVEALQRVLCSQPRRRVAVAEIEHVQEAGKFVDICRVRCQDSPGSATLTVEVIEGAIVGHRVHNGYPTTPAHNAQPDA
ncbi:hypothetical protein ABT084_20935 [Streptomyces sp. NPDC002138]|uniref:hypothetical protein n=1 Tax=Streptomyces sp. NPDC002138 TaxID=3154410 RepID=UPI00331E056B